jgi:hypothetical protein
MLPEITPEEFSDALDAVVRSVLEEAAIAGPPVDALALAGALGIVVAEDGRQSGRGRFVRLQGRRGRTPQPAILLRPEPRGERRQWATAHEIGEHIAWRVFRRAGIDFREVQPRAREETANRLAARLLLPSGWFAADAARCGWDLFALKARYRTASHELIARRMLELPAPAIITVFDQGRMTFRRGNAPGPAPPPSGAEVRCWRAVHAGNRPQAVRDGPGTVCGWPVHEDGWQREILRAEVAMEDGF